MISEGVALVAGPYTADGVNATFDFDFPCTSKNNVEVTISVSGVESVLTLDTEFTVSLNADQSTSPGGTVTITSLPAAGTLVAVASSIPLKQGLDLTQGGSFNPDAIETALDNLVLLIGQALAEIDRCLKLDITSTELASTLQDALLSIGANATAAANSAATASAAADTIDGFENAGARTNGVTYYKNNLVRDGGSTYIVIADPSYVASASAATDIANGHIAVFAQKGDAGAGAGDVVIANNLSEFTASAATARANLGLGSAATKASGTGAGDVPLNSDILGKHTIWVPAGAMTPRTTSGAAAGTVELSTNKVMVKSLDFDYALADEFAQFAVRMPKGWNEGSLGAMFVWSHTTGATAYGVVWGIQGLAVGDNGGAGDALDAAFGTAVLTTDTGGTANDLYQTAEATITVSGGSPTIAGSPAAEDLVIFQVYRDFDHVSDTLDKDARLHGVVLFYTVDAHNDA